MTWVYTELMGWLLGLAGSLFDSLSTSIVTVFSLDSGYFNTAFNGFFEGGIADTIKSLAVTITFILFLIALLSDLFCYITDGYENPIICIVRFLAALVMILYSEQILGRFLDIGSRTYTWMLGLTELAEGSSQISPMTVIAERFEALCTGDEATILSAVGDIFGATAVGTVTIGSATALLGLIMIVAITFSYARLCLEAVERYVVVNLMLIFSPLGAAFVASKNSFKVSLSYLKMFCCELFLMCTNIIFIRGTLLLLKNAAAIMGGAGSTASQTTDTMIASHGLVGLLLSDTGTMPSFILYCFLILGFMKAGQQLDSYMKSLGLDVAQTGRGLGMDIATAVGSLTMGARMASQMSRNGGLTRAISGGIGAVKGMGAGAALGGLFNGRTFSAFSQGAHAATAKAAGAAGAAAGMVDNAINFAGNPKNANMASQGKVAEMMRNGMNVAPTQATAATYMNATKGAAKFMGAGQSGLNVDAAKSVVAGKGATTIAMGNGKQATMTSAVGNPPNNGKPYMTVTGEDGFRMFMQNTGTGNLLGTTPAVGEKMSLAQAVGGGRQYDTLSGYMAGNGISTDNLTVTGLGNGYMAVMDGDTKIGNLVSCSECSDMTSGGIGLSGVQEGMLDTYEFYPTTYKASIDASNFDIDSFRETFYPGYTADSFNMDNIMDGNDGFSYIEYDEGYKICSFQTDDGGNYAIYPEDQWALTGKDNQVARVKYGDGYGYVLRADDKGHSKNGVKRRY